MSALLLVHLLVATADASALLAEGVEAYDTFALDDARDHLTAAQRVATAEQRPLVDLWLGIVELERGNEVDGRRWVRAALQASPGLKVQDALSPKVVKIIELTRRQVARAAPPAAANPTPITAPPAPAAPVDAPNATVAPPAAPGASSSAAPPSSSSSSAPAEPSLPDPPSDAPLDVPALAVAGGGAGVVAVLSVVAGGVLGSMASAKSAEANAAAEARVASSRYQTASTLAMAANALYAASGIAVVVGAVCGGLWMAQGEEP